MGDGLIVQLAKDLSAAFPGVKGFSRTNLSYIRQWYLFYSGEVVAESEKVQQVAAQIPWGHNMLIINKCSSAAEGLFYVRETIRNGRGILKLH